MKRSFLFCLSLCLRSLPPSLSLYNTALERAYVLSKTHTKWDMTTTYSFHGMSASTAGACQDRRHERPNLRKGLGRWCYHKDSHSGQRIPVAVLQSDVPFPVQGNPLHPAITSKEATGGVNSTTGDSSDTHESKPTRVCGETTTCALKEKERKRKRNVIIII